MFAAFARTLWAFAICFIILATSMRNSKGKYLEIYHVMKMMMEFCIFLLFCLTQKILPQIY